MEKLLDRLAGAIATVMMWCQDTWCRVFGHRVLPLALTMQERFPITIVVARCHRCLHQVDAGGTVNLLPPGPPATTDQFMADIRNRVGRTRVTQSARR